MIEPEVVQVHSITPTDRGWRVTVYQSAQILFLPDDHPGWATMLETAKRERADVMIAWEPDTARILSVTP